MHEHCVLIIFLEFPFLSFFFQMKLCFGWGWQQTPAASWDERLWSYSSEALPGGWRGGSIEILQNSGWGRRGGKGEEGEREMGGGRWGEDTVAALRTSLKKSRRARMPGVWQPPKPQRSGPGSAVLLSFLAFSFCFGRGRHLEYCSESKGQQFPVASGWWQRIFVRRKIASSRVPQLPPSS